MAEPKIVACQPGFKIDNYEAAVEHYVDWLGFNLDWEWRAEPGAPVILSVTRDELSLFLNEEEGPAGIWLRVSVVGLPALVDEWNSKRPDAVELILEQPFELPTAYIADPFGNGLALQELQTEASLKEQEIKVAEVLEYLVANHEGDDAWPTPERIAEQCEVSLGIASEALNAFADKRH